MRSIFDVKRGLALLVLVFLCVFGAKAQGDLTGLYYIDNPNTSGHNVNNYPASYWYLVPASTTGGTNVPLQAWAWNNNPETPFITTYHTNKDDNSIWEIRKVDGQNYYYIIHHESQKYVVYNAPVYSNRKAFHLETISDPDHYANRDYILYAITFIGNSTTQPYNICPKNLVTSTSNRFLNPARGNYAYYYGYTSQTAQPNVSGLIGIYNDANDTGSKWYFERIVLTPTISFNHATYEVTISSATGEDIYYTVGATPATTPDPTTALTPHTSPYTFTQTTACTIKAIAAKDGVVSEVTTFNVEKAATPVIQADPTLNFITITCATEGVTIYYTNDGSNPTTASYVYTEPLDFSYSLQPIKAFAVSISTFDSDVATNTIQLKCPAPEIYPEFENNLVYLYCDAPDATMYYTVDGSNPTTSSTATQYTGTPFPLPASGTIKAYATRLNSYPSDVASFDLEKAATPTIQADADDKYITMTTATIGAAIYYTIDGSNPDPANNPNTIRYVGPFREGPNHERVSDVVLKAIAVKTGMFWSDAATGTVVIKCEAPHIVHTGATQFTLSCTFPSTGASIYYTTNGQTATTSSTHYSGAVTATPPVSFHAIAVASHYNPSDEAIKSYLTTGLAGAGTDADPFLIESDYEYTEFVAMANGEYASKHYKLVADIDASGSSIVNQTFTGMFESTADAEGNFYTISNLDHPMFAEINPGVTDGSFPTNRGIVRNVILKDVNISGHAGNTGAIACKIMGGACIYNCGILSGEVGGTGNVGGIVGLLQHTVATGTPRPYNLTRVINC